MHNRTLSVMGCFIVSPALPAFAQVSRPLDRGTCPLEPWPSHRKLSIPSHPQLQTRRFRHGSAMTKSTLVVRCSAKPPSTDDCDVSSLSTPSPLKPGAVVEVWSRSQLHFGIIATTYAKGIVSSLLTISEGKVITIPDAKVSFDEIVSVWPKDITPACSNAAAATAVLTGDVERGLALLKTSSPRSLDLTGIHTQLVNGASGRSPAPLSSSEMARLVFPKAFRNGVKETSGKRERYASLTVAAAVLMSSDTIRFKRAPSQSGWRVLPSSVTMARQRCSFVELCQSILEGKSTASATRKPVWTRAQLDILRDIQIVAASGTAATGTAATALRALGYEPSDDGAAKLLLDIQYWGTGAARSRVNGEANAVLDDTPTSTQSTSARSGRVSSEAMQKAGNGARDWTFPSEILAEAREIRGHARKKRMSLAGSPSSLNGNGRRSLLQTRHGKRVRAYCIDDKKSRFLDDALSVELLNKGSAIRVSLHIADVDEVVQSGSPIDKMARDRGETLYLPLKPLHMLPAAVMEAASFSSTMPTEAITVAVDVHSKTGEVLNWEVFASVVPPVTRINYEQFDLALEKGESAAQISVEQSKDLLLIANAASFLVDRLDGRRLRRRVRYENGNSDGNGAHNTDRRAKGIAAVRLVKRSDKSSSKTVRVAQVVDFQSTESHIAVDGVLTSAGALIRQFAKENNAQLPEGRDASSYVARCGTAPLRRYADLATQRQIKCVLFGRQPAGKRRMHELRAWLAKRHSAGERTVAEKRRSALFDSLSNHCAQQCSAAGVKYAVVRGVIRNMTVTKSGNLRFDVTLDGTGLSTSATPSDSLLCQIRNADLVAVHAHAGDEDTVSIRSRSQERDDLLLCAETVVPLRSKVSVEIQAIDTVAQKIQASIKKVLE